MIKSKMEFNKDEIVPMLGTLWPKFSFLVVSYVAFLFVIQFSLNFFWINRSSLRDKSKSSTSNLIKSSTNVYDQVKKKFETTVF